MGRDKAALELEGVPLVARVARVLAACFDDVMLVGGDPPAATPGRRVPDPDGPACSLRGLLGALGAARAPAERVLVVATDLALVTPELALGLVAFPEHDVVAPRRSEGAEPLCALYRCSPVAAVARERLARGELSLRGLLAAVDTAWVEGSDLEALDPEGRALTNLNTPEDWQRVRDRRDASA